ncbi:MAG: hypothetical protein FWH23_08225 [Bacteroidales bacterium]|nr:hypothetical protein [Bacteroidales bacterium]
MMKTIYTIACLLLMNAGLAQTTGQEVRETQNLDAYVGVWEYANATDTFRIVLRKGIESLPHSYSECLIGGYRYVKQGVLIGDYTQGAIPSQFLFKDFSVEDETITVLASNAHANPERINPNQLYVFFKDRGLGKTTTQGQILLLSPTQIRWILEESEGVYLTEEDIPPAGFSVPTDVVMTKISDTVP